MGFPAPRQSGFLFLFPDFFAVFLAVIVRGLLTQRRVQRLDHLIHVLFLYHVRRQKAQHGFVRAVDDNPFLQQLLGYGLRQFRRVQIHGQHQARAADVLNRFVLLVQRFERRVKIFAESANMLQQLLLLTQKLDGNGAGQRTSTECGPVHTRMHATRNPFGGEDGAERQAARQRFGDGDHVRQHTIVLVGKMASGATEAALNLVKHKQRAALFRQARGEFEKLPIDRTNPALALNGLDAHGADAGIKFSFQVVEVIELYESHAGHKRNKRRAIFGLTGGGERAKGATMKRVIHGQNARLWIWIGLAAILILHLRKGAGEFERSFPGLGATVAKESAVQSGDLRQQPREFRLILVEEQIGNMNQSTGLTLDRRLNGRVIVAERVDADSTQEIQIPLVPRVPEIHTAPANKKDGLALVGGKQ